MAGRGHHAHHASLTSFDDIKERQALVQRQQAQSAEEHRPPRTAHSRPRVKKDSYVHPLTLGQQHRSARRQRRVTTPVGVVQWHSAFILKTSDEHSWLIHNPGVYPVCTSHLAAIRIQRWWRSLSLAQRTKRTTRRLQSDPHWQHPYQLLLQYVQSHPLVTVTGHRLPVSGDDSALVSYFDLCATVIQRAWRHHRTLRYAMYQRRLLYHRAARTIQRAWRLRLSRRKSRAQHFIDSIVTIQRAWRRFTNRRLYFYFRDLIRQRDRTDPSMVLKSLGVSDTASGLYVRFRLGGETLPPLIYYKIFTSHHITDIGSFAPRDYALDQRRQRQRIRQTHVSQCENARSDTRAWYQRWENNGWRLMSSLQLAQSVEQDPITVQTSKARTWHHPNKLVRAADLARKRKAKQIAWKKKLYGLNRTLTQEECKEAVTLPSLAPQYESDEEVDELLSWCSTLSFNDYQQDWSVAGATDSQSHTSLRLPHIHSTQSM